MPTWENMQTNARKLMAEGITLLRAGAHEAAFIAGTTASAAKLHMTIRKNRLEIYRELHDLGQLLFEAMSAKPVPGSIPITTEMRGLIQRVRELGEEAERAQKELNKFSVVKKKAHEVSIPIQRAPRARKQTKARRRPPTPKRHAEAR